MRKLILLVLVLTYVSCATAQVADKVTVIDNRNVNDPPTSFSKEARFHFKVSSVVGLPADN